MKTITIKDDGKLKTSEIKKLMEDKFKTWSYYDDKQLDKNFPAPKKPTERAFLANPEPDAETLGMSVDEAEKKGYKNGITLRERMLLEIAYFDQTGEHLDVKGITFCNGSRYSDGYVPRVGWYDSEVRVGWGSLDDSDSDYGLRSGFPLDLSLLSLEARVEKIEAWIKNVQEINL